MKTKKQASDFESSSQKYFRKGMGRINKGVHVAFPDLKAALLSYLPKMYIFTTGMKLTDIKWKEVNRINRKLFPLGRRVR